MNNKQTRLVTAEAVRKGHPDKFCDQVADAILDAHLSYDPNARVAVEVMATAGKITIGGEITSRASINYEQVVAGVMHQIGYRWHDLCEDERDELDIQIAVHEQSTDIAAAVDGRFPDSTLGAGDQGIMYGYATDETMARMPRAFQIAQKICMLLDEEAAHTPWLGVDGKAQVSLKYEGDRVFVHIIVVSVQHAPNAPEARLRNLVTLLVYQAVGRADMWDSNSKLLVNPSGRFVLGGPAADTGMTGRKLAVDQYGPIAHIGGGALSGKDATKVDRSGAYAARWIARNLVAAKLCRECEVQLVYAIGIAYPIGLTVNTFGTGAKPDSELVKLVWRVFDLRPAAIINRLKLTTPSYSLVSVYGHFGRLDLNLPWERDDMVDQLLEAAHY
ncbi:MAG: methionine adenosyltransferase [Oscillospiraceae bacterium]|nr:methionine adenosyltransferase [Oscillospiraceae bacterium]